MKLLNLTSRYFAIALLILIPIWAAIFYYAMLDEIYDSIDDGLDNQKGLIVRKASADTLLLSKNNFDEGDYAIREISPAIASTVYDQYIDTMMYMENEKSEEPVRMLKTVFLQDNRYYSLMVVTSMVEEDDLIRELLYAMLWLYGGLVITIVVLNNFLLKKIWKPFQDLLVQLRSFRLDKPVQIVSTPSKVEEFTKLSDTVQKLLDRNIHIYSSQKQFTENASHELQTPLAIAITKLETLAEDNRLSEDQLSLLSAALDNLERLTRLNKSLLLLSKIDNRQFPDVQPVELNAITRKVLEDFSDQAEFNKLRINYTDTGVCVQQMNADLALIMITNLVKNAIVHNHHGGFVHVTISGTNLVVENSGSSVSLEENRIFERFHSGQVLPDSTGLGLAIVKAIADVSHTIVSYEFTGVHRITVKFSSHS